MLCNQLCWTEILNQHWLNECVTLAKLALSFPILTGHCSKGAQTEVYPEGHAPTSFLPQGPGLSKVQRSPLSPRHVMPPIRPILQAGSRCKQPKGLKSGLEPRLSKPTKPLSPPQAFGCSYACHHSRLHWPQEMRMIFPFGPDVYFMPINIRLY